MEIITLELRNLKLSKIRELLKLYKKKLNVSKKKILCFNTKS